MRRLAIMSAVLLFVLVGWIQSASAGVCVQIDESKDTLAKKNRKAAKITLEGVFSDNGLKVVETKCGETYKVYHVELGDKLTVYMKKGDRTEKRQVNSLDDLNSAYDQLVKVVALGKKAPKQMDNITTVQSSERPKHLKTDTSFNVRLGYGGLFGAEAFGPKFGLSILYRIENNALELSFLDFTVDTYNDGSGGPSQIEWFGLGGRHYFSPLSNQSFYLGGKVSLTTSTGASTGLTANSQLGLEVLRTADTSGFVEINAGVPMYDINGDVPMYGSLAVGMSF